MTFQEKIATPKKLTPAQKHLLTLFAYNDSDEFVHEIQEVLTQHFQKKLDKKLEQLRKDGVITDEILDKWMTEDFHAKN